MTQQRRIELFVDFLYKKDYRERPASVDEILSSPNFFGSLTNNGKAVYPIWKQKLSEVMAEDSKYLIVHTGAIGTGKTRAAVWGIGCGMQKVLCLKNPFSYFNLAAGGRITIVFFNLTKTLSKGKAFQTLQGYLLSSPWFRSRGIVRSEGSNQWLDIPLFEYVLASPYARGFGSISGDVLFAIMDEVDSETESLKQKEKVLQAYNGTVRRFKSRFVDPIYNETLGKFFLCASKQEELSFLNTFVTEWKGSPNLVVVDIPYWAKLPIGKLSGKKFLVAVGNDYVPSRIVTSVEDRILAKDQGLQLEEIPMEFYKDFENDLVGALKEIAGISVGSLRRTKLFSSEKILRDCYDKTKQDPISRTTIMISLGDDIDLIKFVDFTKIRVPKSIPRFIHCDIAYSGDGDALSLAMSGVRDWRTTNVMVTDGRFAQRSLPVVETDFAFRLKGKPGGQIPIFKMRKFVLDLRTLGFNIQKFTADLRLLSEDTRQILTEAGLNCDYLSLDKDLKPYLTFKDIVQDCRWIFHPNSLVHFELSNLEHDDKTGKVDHPDKVVNITILDDGGEKEEVLKGSKDLSDAIAGSVYSAILDVGGVPVTKDDITTILRTVREGIRERTPEQILIDQLVLPSKVNQSVAIVPMDVSNKDNVSEFIDLLKHVGGKGI